MPSVSKEVIRGAILEFEKILKTMDTVELPVDQYFCEGLYGRALHIPAGAQLVGEIHKDECISICLKGTIEIVTEHGISVISAPKVLISPKGIKRAGRAISDCIFLTIHPNQSNTHGTPEEMKNIFSVPTYDLLEDKSDVS